MLIYFFTILFHFFARAGFITGIFFFVPTATVASKRRLSFLRVFGFSYYVPSYGFFIILYTHLYSDLILYNIILLIGVPVARSEAVTGTAFAVPPVRDVRARVNDYCNFILFHLYIFFIFSYIKVSPAYSRVLSFSDALRTR